jgi:hypothetical protein
LLHFLSSAPPLTRTKRRRAPPLMVLTLLLHVVGLALINLRMVRLMSHLRRRHQFFPMFVLVMGVTALLAILLLGFETTLWAAAFRTLGALADGRSAILYSLNAFTSYGHTDLELAPHWRLMGALEALNGMLLFGLTTAFLYGHIRHAWPAELREAEVPATTTAQRGRQEISHSAEQ